jgi:hypothetical protein
MAYGYQSVTVNSGAASGNDGSATANNTSSHVVVGEICSIGVTYGDSPPGTTDVTVATAGNNGPALTLLTITNANSNGWFHLRHKTDDETGADITYDGSNEVYEKVCIADNIKVTIAQANSPDTAEVVVVYYAGA